MEEPARGVSPSSPGDVGFVGACTVAFLAAAAATVRLCAPMAEGMPMAGGWTLSMAWMRMPGQSWAAAWAGFTGTWTVMMVAMMLPVASPTLLRYGLAAGDVAGGGSGVRTLLAGVGYFSLWATLGAVLFPGGALLAGAVMRWAPLARALPVLAGGTLLLAGAVQLSRWKARQLARCRDEPGCVPERTSSVAVEHCCAPPRRPTRGPAAAPGPLSAWRDGLRLGGHCALCCCGLMAALAVLGAMDVRVMAVLAAAIAAERLLPWPERIARVNGVLLLVAATVVLAGWFMPA